jgi:hypothetical protein
MVKVTVLNGKPVCAFWIYKEEYCSVWWHLFCNTGRINVDRKYV